MVNKEKYEQYMKLFLEENSKVNLISKKDEKFLWEKHIFDSLAINNFFEKHNPKRKNLLDIGTGGGFPALPIAITYPEIKVVAVDSIGKKIRAIENIKNGLELQNIEPICTRVENLDKKFDIITSRAVASLDKICEYALPKLEKNGYFIAYKSKKVNEEIEQAKTVLKKYKAEVIEIIEYKLPLEEEINRNLVIIKKF